MVRGLLRRTGDGHARGRLPRTASAGCALAYDHPFLGDVAYSEIVRGPLIAPERDMAAVVVNLMAFFGRGRI
jgi:hypothetical protein